MRTQQEFQLFHSVFSAMGLLLLAIAGWIGMSVAHLPAIEQKLDDYIISSNNTLADFDKRITAIENKTKEK